MTTSPAIVITVNFVEVKIEASVCVEYVNVTLAGTELTVVALLQTKAV